MNNMLSYCGLVDAKIKASDKDLPVQWSEEMCEIFVNEDISKIDLKQVYQEAEELILEEKFEQGSKLYGKVIWALIEMVRFF